jgi:hypothetical protein
MPVDWFLFFVYINVSKDFLNPLNSKLLLCFFEKIKKEGVIPL